MTNINILYWDTGCQSRKQNTMISWDLTKKMVDNLKNRGLEIQCFLFEFGENFQFEDSIKIETKLDFYERSKKINIVLNHPVNQDSKFLSIMDSDLFFIEEQYDEVYEDIKSLEEKNKNHSTFFTYNLLDLDESQRNYVLDTESMTIDFEKLKEIKSDLAWRHSWGSGTLGGYFIAPTEALKKMGGYNENYITWGAEDDDALTRIKNYSAWMMQKNKGPYHLYHSRNTLDEKYYVPVYSDRYFELNKVEKPR
jgi:predicted glycosyltransferase involved in capsule biosynthesis